MLPESPRSHNQRSVYLGLAEAGRFCACGAAMAKRQRITCVACRFWAKVARGPDCWTWTSNIRWSQSNKPEASYGTFYHDGRPRSAHEIAWKLTHGWDSIPAGYELMHACDNARCVRPDHLALGTHADNMQDASRKGRLRIPRPGRHKVTAEQIAEIRSLVAAGWTHKAVAAHFGIARNTVTDLVNGKSRRYDAPLPAIEQAS